LLSLAELGKGPVRRGGRVVRPKSLPELVDVVGEVLRLLQLPETDVVWSRYRSPQEAIQDLTSHLRRLKCGDLAGLPDLKLLFAPTGPLQEISISSGWGDRFIDIAARLDAAIGEPA
jgi:hypothetical protein